MAVQSLSSTVESLAKGIANLNSSMANLETLVRDRSPPPPASNATVPYSHPTNVAVPPVEIIGRTIFNGLPSSPQLSEVIPVIPDAPPNPVVELRRRLLQNAVVRRRPMRVMTIQLSNSDS